METISSFAGYVQWVEHARLKNMKPSRDWGRLPRDCHEVKAIASVYLRLIPCILWSTCPRERGGWFHLERLHRWELDLRFDLAAKMAASPARAPGQLRIRKGWGSFNIPIFAKHRPDRTRDSRADYPHWL